MGGFGARQIAAVVAGIFVVVAMAACDSDDATPPAATPVPSPTATTQVLPPATTALTVAPTQPAATPTTIPLPPRVAISIDELEITDETTLSDVIGALSDDEVACIQDAAGASVLTAILNVPLSALPSELSEPPPECLSEESAIGLAVAYLARDAGGLDEETRSCVKNVATQFPAALDIGDPPENPIEIVAGSFGIQLCLTDEEAANLAPGGEDELPPPSALRCLAEQMGGQEALLAALSQGEEDPSIILGLMVATQSCEPEPNAPASS